MTAIARAGCCCSHALTDVYCTCSGAWAALWRTMATLCMVSRSSSRASGAGREGILPATVEASCSLFFLGFGVALPLPLPPVTLARYGLYALRRRSSATHLSPDPTLHNAEGVDATLSDGQQVGSALCCEHFFSKCVLRTEAVVSYMTLQMPPWGA
jgi:hypothetical protein